MKKNLIVLCALSLLNGFCAEKKISPFAAKDAARATFNKLHGEVFRGTKAVNHAVIERLSAAEHFTVKCSAALRRSITA